MWMEGAWLWYKPASLDWGVVERSLGKQEALGLNASATTEKKENKTNKKLNRQHKGPSW
jgi:hypothetical protein